MKRNRVTGCMTIPALLLACASGAGAAAEFRIEFDAFDSAQGIVAYTVSVDKDKLKWESNYSSGKDIYRADKGVIWMISGGDDSYAEMTLGEWEEMSAATDSTIQRLMDRAATLPPDQRKEAMAYMPEYMTPAGGRRPAYRKAAAGAAGPWDCRMYEGFVAGAKKVEACMADARRLGLSESDIRAFRELGKPFAKQGKQLLPMILALEGGAQAPPGFPVRMVILEDGKAKAEIRVKDVKTDSLPPGRFEVPPGYTKAQ